MSKSYLGPVEWSRAKKPVDRVLLSMMFVWLFYRYRLAVFDPAIARQDAPRQARRVGG